MSSIIQTQADKRMLIKFLIKNTVLPMVHSFLSGLHTGNLDEKWIGFDFFFQEAKMLCFCINISGEIILEKTSENFIDQNILKENSRLEKFFFSKAKDEDPSSFTPDEFRTLVGIVEKLHESIKKAEHHHWRNSEKG